MHAEILEKQILGPCTGVIWYRFMRQGKRASITQKSGVHISGSTNDLHLPYNYHWGVCILYIVAPLLLSEDPPIQTYY